MRIFARHPLYTRSVSLRRLPCYPLYARSLSVRTLTHYPLYARSVSCLSLSPVLLLNAVLCRIKTFSNNQGSTGIFYSFLITEHAGGLSLSIEGTSIEAGLTSEASQIVILLGVANSRCNIYSLYVYNLMGLALQGRVLWTFISTYFCGWKSQIVIDCLFIIIDFPPTTA